MKQKNRQSGAKPGQLKENTGGGTQSQGKTVGEGGATPGKGRNTKPTGNP